MKSLKFLLSLTLCMLCFASCKEDVTISKGYSFGIHYFEYPGVENALGAVTSYLKGKSCPMGAEIYEGNSEADADAKAAAAFNEAMKSVSVEDIDALGFEGLQFTYSVTRYASDNVTLVIVAEFNYPGE